MDNILDADLVDLYLQLRYIPNSMISRVIPDLDDPNNELQYQAS